VAGPALADALLAAAAGGEITADVLARAEGLVGLELTEDERRLMLEGLAELREDYAAIRAVPLDNGVPPAFAFDPEAAAGRGSPAAAPRPARSPEESRCGSRASLQSQRSCS